MKTKVSVVMAVRNVEKYIDKCLRSILDQTVKDFEIVIVDDASNDNTKNIIAKFDDRRIRYFRNEKWLGISKSRNKSVKFAKGEYLFFTDGDCQVSKNWVEEGMKHFKNLDFVGVEGKIYYVSEDYEPTFSDHVMENRSGGNFMTGNIAYRKQTFEAVGGFDEEMTYLEDRDIALRIMKLGKIIFNPEMIVYHPKVVVTPKLLIESASRTKNRVVLFKKFGERKFLLWRILFPRNLVKILFPPLTFLSLVFGRFKSSDDYKLVPFGYIYAICERWQIWKECVKEGVFLI